MAMSTPRPFFSLEQALGLVRRLYGLEGEARELPSERDQNFHIRAADGADYVLKISNSAEQRGFLDFQDDVLVYLAEQKPALGVPRILPQVSGKLLSLIPQRSGQEHFVRLLSFLPGRFLAEVKPHRPELLGDLGRFLGELDNTLAGYGRSIPARDLKWDMRNGPVTVRRFLGLIQDRRKRQIVEHFLDRFQEDVSPLLSKLRTGLLFNDANDHNVLVGYASPDLFGRWMKVTGIIDFGDMVSGWLAVEPAVAAAYVMMGKDDPLESACHVVAGFHEVLPLTEDDLACLYGFICLRLCLSVAISAEQHSKEKDNAYLCISEKPAWELLERLREVNPRLAHYTFRNACGLLSCPQTAEIVHWLKENSARIGPVIEPDLETSPQVVLDFSVGSLELGPLSYSDDPQAVEALIASRLKAAGKAVAVGQYNEARTAYSGKSFEVKVNDGTEMRTVHLGIDLFLPPGSAVLAPLDGFIHSFKDNAADQDYGPTIILEHRIPGGPAFFTLYGHLSRASLDRLREGGRVHRGDKIAEIGRTSENGGWPPHLHFQIVADLLDRRGEFPGVALPSRRSLWLGISPDPNLILKVPESEFPAPSRSREEIFRQRQAWLGPSLSVSYRKPLMIVRGFRQYLYDQDGQAYLDSVNNVPQVGHSHPRVVRAIQSQAAVLNTNTRYLHDNIVEYARRLGQTLPQPLGVFFFVNSGSEANDLALRLAWAHTGRREVIVVDGAYHGNLSSLVEISPYKFDGPGGRGAPPHLKKALLPDVFRGLFRRPDPEAGRKYAQSVEEVIEGLRLQGLSPASFIGESLMSCAGQIVLPDGYLRTVYRAVRAAGGVCIADEVQVGFGRVGTHFWGFETQGVVPDIVTLGKPMGNGHPLGAVITTPEIAASFRTGMEYFNTYGGNPVSCAAGLAVLDVIRDEGLQANALAVGNHLRAGLEKLKGRYPLLGDVRGLGLFLGIELVRDSRTLEPADGEASYIVERMRDKRVLASTDGIFHNVIKIKPPLVYTKDNADTFLGKLEDVLQEDVLNLP
jgi:4-aminobutyrate aminotransferase-like enzyme/Ser/Thr protein kinase RdoA (MazF antagonist)/murein DD-endopeptidase MepM/ murein hydrolase activator NlpD